MNKNVPDIRFKGFSEGWAKKELGELADIVRGASPRPIEDPKWFNNNSDVGWLRIRDVTEQGGRIKYLEQRISKLGQEKTRVLKEEHLLLSIAASVGKPVINYVETGVHDGFLIFKKPQFELEYMYQWLKFFEPKWQQYGQPGSQVNLNSDIVKNHQTHLPKKTKEQTQIGAYFYKLDSLISQHQQKHDKLSNIKKAMLEKMFPTSGETLPEIRFDGFSGDWWSVSLERAVDITMGQSPNGVNYTLNPDDHILVQGNADLKGGYVYPRVWTTEVTKKAFKGDLIFSVRAPVGEVGKTEHDVVLGRGVAALNGNEFIFQQLKKIQADNYWNKVSAGSTFDAISSSELAKTQVLMTSDCEQTKIGNYFNKLDELIKQHQHQITKLNNIKQACLNKMFV